MSAQFSWPSLRINTDKLRKMVVGNQKKRKKKKGLFVFPLQSQITGARYSYLWMTIAQENGWHVLLDASALGPKDMDTLGLSLFHPDFIICSCFKVFGEDPSGLGCLFVKKSTISSIEASAMAKSIGIVSILPPTALSLLQEDSSGAESRSMEDVITSSLSDRRQLEVGERLDVSSEIIELDKPESISKTENYNDFHSQEIDGSLKIECRGLDHADSLGLILISSRIRYLANWLVSALMKLRHPHAESGIPLVRIYGPKVKFDRGPSLAFNIFDWKGERVEPALVQKLADRNNISLSYGFLQNIWFSEKYEYDKQRVLETKSKSPLIVGDKKRKQKAAIGVQVVTVSIGFLADFEDVYRLWAFTAKFLDADFLEKERWRYMALNQETVEV